MNRHSRVNFFLTCLGMMIAAAAAFTPLSRPNRPLLSAKSSNDEWNDLSGDGGVLKKIIQTGNGEQAESDTSVSIDYKGTVDESNWSTEEVITCFLNEQQGLEDLADGFRSHEIDGTKLTDLDFFTEDFVQIELGVTAKIKCKKLVLAAKRLATTRVEFPAGVEFDANKDWQFVLGKGKVIKGMELGVASMTRGEVAQIKCRCDYAYRAEGCRQRGNVMVPPFCTILFELRLN
jgi:FKBP-type peptidyl-prolyl cis-trans isomerase 2